MSEPSNARLNAMLRELEEQSNVLRVRAVTYAGHIAEQGERIKQLEAELAEAIKAAVAPADLA